MWKFQLKSWNRITNPYIEPEIIYFRYVWLNFDGCDQILHTGFLRKIRHNIKQFESGKFLSHNFLQLGFTSYKTEQPLQGMELQEKEAHKG